MLKIYPETTAPGLGESSPLGATICPGGVNFSAFPKGGINEELLPFDRVDNP